jgi:hypothetical protein
MKSNVPASLKAKPKQAINSSLKAKQNVVKTTNDE